MIDFSTITEITIPEGVTTKIMDSSDNVLWSAPLALVEWDSSGNGSLSSDTFTINTESPITIYGSDDIGSGSVEIPIGTTITCRLIGGVTTLRVIRLNGTFIASSMGEEIYYTYTVKNRVHFKITTTNGTTVIDITERGPKTVTIDSSCTTADQGSLVICADFPTDASMSTISNPAIIEATSGLWSYQVPYGTVIECSARYIYVNGSSRSYMYDHTVLKDVTITMKPSAASGGGLGEIRIVET